MSYNTLTQAHAFYNPSNAAFYYKVPATFSGVNIKIAKSLNPGATGRPQKGQKVYNHERACNFTMTPDECIRLLNAFPDIASGKYIDPLQKNEQYKHTFSLTHFRETGASILSVSPAKNKDGAIINGIFISITPPKNSTDEDRAYYMLRPGEETTLFLNFLSNVGKNLQFVQSCIAALFGTVSMGGFNFIKSRNGYNGSSGYNNNVNQQQQYQQPQQTQQYQQPQTPQQPPQDLQPQPNNFTPDSLFSQDNSDLPF